MKTKKLMSIFLLILLTCSCNNNAKSKIEISESSKETTCLTVEVNEKEDFDVFFSKFQQDSIFQINRIEFPIKYHIYESGSYIDDSENVIDLQNREVIINKNEWNYQNIDEYIKIISKISENEYHIELQIEDTGVSVNYVFKIKNNEWFLVEIVDEST